MWRAERPQRGRYRQFYQCDIDMIGEASVLAEAELIEATTEALAAIGLTGTTVRVSDRRFLWRWRPSSGVPADQLGAVLHHGGQAGQDRVGRGAFGAGRARA